MCISREFWRESVEPNGFMRLLSLGQPAWQQAIKRGSWIIPITIRRPVPILLISQVRLSYVSCLTNLYEKGQLLYNPKLVRISTMKRGWQHLRVIEYGCPSPSKHSKQAARADLKALKREELWKEGAEMDESLWGGVWKKSYFSSRIEEVYEWLSHFRPTFGDVFSGHETLAVFEGMNVLPWRSGHLCG